MKKLFIYGTMALMALTSCNDFLDKAPLDAFTNTPAYWSNTSNLDNQCNTFYNNYSGYGNGSGGGWFYFKTLSDDQVDYQSTVWTYTSVVATSTNWSDPSQKFVVPIILLKDCKLLLLMMLLRLIMKVWHV